MELKTLKLADIAESPFNPRKHYDQAKLAELAGDIGSRGVDSPILVRPTKGQKKPYEAVFGHRRIRASALAGKETIPAVVREMTDLEADKAQVQENDKREDLRPLEQATAYLGLLTRNKLTKDEVALAIGKSRSHVYETLSLNDLVKPVQQAIEDGKLSASSAVEIARVQPSLQPELLKEALRRDYQGQPVHSVRSLKDFIKRDFLLDLKKAPFNTEDAKLLPAAGACNKCPKRSDAQPGLFEDSKGVSLCRDRGCHAAKVEAHTEQRVEKLEKEGKTILSDSESQAALSYSGTWVKLSEQCDADAKRRSWKQLLADGPVKTAFALDGNGAPIEVAKKTELRAYFEAKGSKTIAHSYDLGGVAVASRRSPSEQAAEKKRREQSALKRATALAAIEQMATSKATRDGADGFLRAVVCGLLRVVWSESLKVLAQQLVPDSKNGDFAQVLLAYSAKLKGPELRAFVLRLSMAQAIEGITSYGTAALPRQLEGAAKAIGIDLQKVAAETKRRRAEEANARELAKKQKKGSGHKQVEAELKATASAAGRVIKWKKPYTNGNVDGKGKSGAVYKLVQNPVDKNGKAADPLKATTSFKWFYVAGSNEGGPYDSADEAKVPCYSMEAQALVKQRRPKTKAPSKPKVAAIKKPETKNAKRAASKKKAA